MTAVSSKLTVPAIFLDRDGTIMRDVDYCSDPKKVEIFAGVPEGLRRLQQRGYKIFVITNQSGIGRGYLSDAQYRAVEKEVLRQVGGDLIDATYYCPHLPDDHCKCRKPSPEMILNAARDHELDLARSFLIGDKASDMECGRNAGVQTILVRTGYGKQTEGNVADFIAQNVSEAAGIILRARP
ncbi:MAG: HAD family hydrolase [Verrucomicrobiota bacterium]